MKTVLVTGGARGIGRAVSFAFAKAGYHVCIHFFRSEEAALSLMEEIMGEGGSCSLFQGDLSAEKDCQAVCEAVIRQKGAPDVLVNNAGVSAAGLLTDMTPEDYQRVMDTNFKSVYMLTRLFYPHMVHRKRGCIINISSMWGILGASCEALYSASKGAVVTFTKALAKELGPSFIRVNCIAPGVIQTDMMKDYTQEEIEELRQSTPLLRIGQPEDVAAAALFLASDNASFITGQTLMVDGGFSL